MEQTNVVPTWSKQTRTVALRLWFKSKTCGFSQVLECSSGFLCPTCTQYQNSVPTALCLFPCFPPSLTRPSPPPAPPLNDCSPPALPSSPPASLMTADPLPLLNSDVVYYRLLPPPPSPSTSTATTATAVTATACASLAVGPATPPAQPRGSKGACRAPTRAVEGGGEQGVSVLSGVGAQCRCCQTLVVEQLCGTSP